MLTNWISRLLRTAPRPASTDGPVKRCRPRLEHLEAREVPALAVTTGLTPTQLVNQLLGQGVVAKNVVLTKGTPTSTGKFTGGGTTASAVIGFDKGIILSTGNAMDVVATDSSTTAASATNTGNDPDLDAIVAPAGTTTFDATVLEFDFIPQGATLKFKYVFSSEEYNFFVGSAYNDVFAFYLNQVNIALIPGTQTPVSINNVNNGQNSQYYRDNDPGPIPTAMNGLTTVLTATANVKVGQLNHIKLAIADAGDTTLDSDVFIQSGSFSAARSPLLASFAPLRFAARPAGYIYPVRWYEGTVVVTNFGTQAASGPFRVTFTRLPFGSQVLNASGRDAETGLQYIKLNVASLPVNGVMRFKLRVTNPFRLPMGSYFNSAFGFQLT